MEELDDEPVSQRPKVSDAGQQPTASTAGSLPAVLHPRASEQDTIPLSSAPGVAMPHSPTQPADGTSGQPLSAENPQQNVVSTLPPHGGPDTRQEVETLPDVADATGAGKDAGEGAMNEAAGPQGDGLESNQRVEEDFQPSLPMQEMVVNFLLRMAFVIGGDRDHDLQASKWLHTSSL